MVKDTKVAINFCFIIGCISLNFPIQAIDGDVNLAKRGEDNPSPRLRSH